MYQISWEHGMAQASSICSRWQKTRKLARSLAWSFYLHHCVINRTPVKSLLKCSLITIVLSGQAIAQMGGGGGGAQGTPLFDEPKFKDRVYEAGGPRIADSKSDRLILSVSIEGNRSVSEHKILSMMQSRPDRLYDSDSFNRDIGELYRSGLFDRIEPGFKETDEGVHIRLVVREKPTVISVVFHGNKALDDKQLKKHCGLDVGDPCGPSSVNAAASRLIEYYQDQGFNSADVQVISGGKPGEREIIFKISEGSVERIWDIKFVGNAAFSESLLKARLKIRDARNGVTAYAWNKASPDAIDEDKERLLNYYRGLGYFDARLDHRIDYDASGKWIYLTFVVSEGQRYSIRNVEIAGNQYYSSDELQSLLKIKLNEPFNQAFKNHDERIIRDVYGEKGFIFADITGRLKYLPDNQVDVLYSIAEGDVYRASDVRVHIDGDATFTKSNVVLTKLGNIRPGRIISSVEMENGERRLQASTIFNSDPADGSPPRIEVQPPDQSDRF